MNPLPFPAEEIDFIKQKLIETSQDYIANYPKRIKEIVEKEKNDELDIVESEIGYFENVLYDIDNPEMAEVACARSGFLSEYLARDICFNIGIRPFKNRTQRKIDFLNQRIPILLSELKEDSQTDEVENYESTIKKLTRQQQILLLDILGVLDLLKDVETTKKSILISSLIGKNQQNIRESLTYFGVNSEKNPLQNPNNLLNVVELLEKIGLEELALSAKEKYKKVDNTK